jgi:glycerophosphoryl diester phosphodiesterase
MTLNRNLAAWPYPTVVAHRGGGALAPENTLAAFRTGARLGHRMVEFDAKLSRDDVSFLLHDDSVDRTSNGHGAAADLSYDELAQWDAGSWFAAEFAGEPMPTLEAVAQTCHDLALAVNVEIKPCLGRERATGLHVAQDVLRYWRDVKPAPLLSSFSYVALAAAREAAPALPRGLLFDALPTDWQAQAQALECISIHVSHRQLTAAQVDAIGAAGFRLMAYTVNDLQRAQELLGWGVDAICTDRIDLIGPDLKA